MVALVTLFLGFLAGALTTIVAEVVAVVLVIRRLNRRVQDEASKSARGMPQLRDTSLLSSYYNKQGAIWVLDPEKVPKSWPIDKISRDQKQKKDIFEVAPVRKNAKIKDHTLILTESDGSHRVIQLKGSSIAAVSATALSSGKWAKKYPIKVESKTSILYKGSKTIYIYLETSWDKEAWCKALRLASCDDMEKLNWVSKLYLEFQSYLKTLNAGYLSFIKPSVGFCADPIGKAVRLDGSSKVRNFLKKLAKKASKSGVENKTSSALSSGHDERKIDEECHWPPDSVLGSGVVRTTSIQDAPNLSAEEKIGPFLSTHTGADFVERAGSDEGTLCLNLLTSRLFFDAKSNTGIKSFIQGRIQRTLSNMRKPSYIGELTCIGIDFGNLPPYISGMRLLPLDMNEVWAIEIDIEYSGGAVLDIATRIEVRELEFEGGMVDVNLESSPVEEVTSDLLESFEYFGKQLELSEDADDATEPRDESYPKQDGVNTCKATKTSSSFASRWKSILNSIAKQVSQVPLALTIRVASLRGTVRLHIKPPPSDQLWFGFTSMPEIDFNLESFLGERKINSGHIALLLIARFKAAIRETLLLPNCGSVCIPWMLAEKDDWIPREVAPFIRVNQEAANDPAEIRNSQPGEAVTPVTESSRKVECFEQQKSDSFGVHANPTSLQNLSVPLLSNDEPRAVYEDCQRFESQSRSLILAGENVEVMDGDDDLRPKRVGARARMVGLGKKMGGKLEEKRRNIEEKGRHIVDRMRGP